jgi:hypothetical protein
VSGVRFQDGGTRELNLNTAYMKLRQNGTVFLMIKPATLAVAGRTEQRTAACDELSRVEYRISNRRISKGRIAPLCLLNL